MIIDNIPVSRDKFRINWFIQPIQYFFMLKCVYYSFMINESQEKW